MKRILILISMLMVLLMATTQMAFGTLVLEKSSPKDGGDNYQAVNFAVKLYFNQDVNLEKNKNAIHFYDEENKAVDFTLAFSTKETGLALVAVNGDLLQNAKYRVVVDETFESVTGELLKAPITIHFATRDTSKDMTVNMVLMGGMMAVVMVLSTRSLKKKDEEGKKTKKTDDKVNPYKVAKEKGKSVEEVVAKDAKAKERARVQKEKQEAEKEKAKAEILKSKGRGSVDLVDPNKKKVRERKPITLAGSTYKSGKKAIFEAELKKEEARRKAGTTNPKKKRTTGKKK